MKLFKITALSILIFIMSPFILVVCVLIGGVYCLILWIKELLVNVVFEFMMEVITVVSVLVRDRKI